MKKLHRHDLDTAGRNRLGPVDHVAQKKVTAKWRNISKCTPNSVERYSQPHGKDEHTVQQNGETTSQFDGNKKTANNDNVYHAEGLERLLL